MINETLGRSGGWDLQLERVPPNIREKIEAWTHVMIFKSEVDPRDFTIADLRAQSIYTGVVWDQTKSLDSPSIGGPSLLAHLGHNGVGDIFETDLVFSADTFADSLRALLPNGGALVEGTFFSVAGTYDATHRFENPRNGFDVVTDVFGATYRVNHDGTIDAGLESDLYETDPLGASTPLLLVEKAGGSEPNVEVGRVTRATVRERGEDFTTRLLVLAQGTGDDITVGAANAGTNPYKDFFGNDLVRKRILSDPDATQANAAARATSIVSTLSDTLPPIDISVEKYEASRSWRVGDYVGAWLPSLGIVDPGNQIAYQGDVISPQVRRVVQSRWAIAEGMSVVLLAHDQTLVDLTPYVVFEDPSEATIKLGALDSALLSGGSQTPERVSGGNNTIPAAPTAASTPWATSSYVDTDGITRAEIVAQWNTPLNTDGSTITDGSFYELRIGRVSSGGTWPSFANAFAGGSAASQFEYVQVAWGTNLFVFQELAPGVPYEISIRAVDEAGNQSAWSASEFVTASVDTTPPSKPQPPEVAGNPLRIQILHRLKRESDGSFLEGDLDHLNVYVSTTPGFTPDSSNLVGKIAATASSLSLGIPVIGQFDIPDTTTRYVRVSAVDRAGNESTASETASVSAILIDTVHIGDATITTAKIGLLQVTDALIANLDAAKITTGFLDADRIDARSLTVEKLLVGSFDNLIAQPGFERGDFTSWHTVDSGGLWEVIDNPISADGGRYFARYNTDGQTTNARLLANGNPGNRDFHVECFEGEQFALTVRARWGNADPAAAVFRLQLRWHDELGAVISTTGTGLVSLVNSWQTYVVTGAAPAGAVYVVAAVRVDPGSAANARILVDNMVLRKRVGTAVIEDLAVTTAKIADASITTAKIASLAVTNAQIANATITAAKILSLNADAITAGTLDANVVSVINLNASNINTGTLATNRITSLLTGKTYRGTTGIVFAYDASITSGHRLSTLTVQTMVSNAVQVQHSASTSLFNNDVYPGADNTYGLGTSGQRWTDVWAADGTINTSDRRLKTKIRDTALGLEFVRRLQPRQFQWVRSADTARKREVKAQIEALQDEWELITPKPSARSEEIEREIIALQESTLPKRPGRRAHHGFIAQEVDQALIDVGISRAEFAGLIDPGRGEHLGLRYSEFIAPIVAAVQELDRRLDALGG